VLLLGVRSVARNSVWDLLLPVTGVRVVTGAVSIADGLLVVAFYSLCWFLVASVRFAVEQWRAVRLGVTSFELDHHIKVCRRRLFLLSHLRSVLSL